MSDPNVNSNVSTENDSQTNNLGTNNQTTDIPITNTQSSIQNMTPTNIDSSVDKPTINSQFNTSNSANEKQKLFKIKEGQILRYKKRYFRHNWRPAQLTLYSNGTFMISSNNRLASTAFVKCHKSSTLIVFGQQLEFISKRPIPPNGNKLEHMLAIGLISLACTKQGILKGTQIIFYWFSLSSHQELLDWVRAFKNSILEPNNHQNNKSNQDTFETLSSVIALNNADNIERISNNMIQNSSKTNDDLSLPVLMANATTFNSANLANLATGSAAVGAAGLLTANALYDSRDLATTFFDSTTGQTFRLDNSMLNTTNYLGDASSIGLVDSFGNQIFNWPSDNGLTQYFTHGNRDAVPIAEMATILNAADLLNCSALDCGADCGFDCSVAADGGGDCSFDGAFAAALF